MTGELSQGLMDLYNRQTGLEARLTDNARRYRTLGKEPKPEEARAIELEYNDIKLQLGLVMKEIEDERNKTGYSQQPVE